MPPHIRRFFLLAFTGLLFVTSTLQLYRAFPKNPDIWWTPHALMVPLAESGDRVEIYARGRPLQTLLAAGQLRFAGEASVLAASEVGLRFNNWDRVRADRIPTLVGFAAGCGITAVLFLLILTGRLAYRGEKEWAGADDRTPNTNAPAGGAGARGER